MNRVTRRRLLGSSLVAPFGLAAWPVVAGVENSTGFADTVITHGRVLTMDARLPLAEAVAMRGNLILAVGSNAVILDLVGPGTRRIDASGMTVMPGFIDAHSHPLLAGEATGVNVNLPRISDVKLALRGQAAKTPAGHWVRGYMYDDTIFEDGRPLNRKDIDEVVSGHPVYVAHRGGHTAVVNSKAFEVAGIGSDTPDPVGGKLYRENGEFTGKVAELAVEPFLASGTWPQMTRSLRQEAVKISSRNMAAAGLTSTTDAYGSYDDFLAYQDARAAGELFFRLSFMPDGNSDMFKGMKQAGIRSGFGDDMIRIGAVKFAADGSASERTMSMSTPYAGKPDDFGILTMNQEQIDAAVDDAAAHGFRIGIHANGDVAIDMVLNAYERVLQNHGGVNPRHRIEHCSLINDRILSRIKAAGVVPAPFYTYAYYHGNKWVDYGPEKMQFMFAHKSFLEAGIPVAPASDYTPGPFEPMMAIQSMVTRKDKQGRVWGPAQRITVSEALQICTMHGAYASFEEDVKGSITAGKLADIALLEQDPHDVDPDEIVNIKIIRTLLGGKTVYEA